MFILISWWNQLIGPPELNFPKSNNTSALIVHVCVCGGGEPGGGGRGGGMA